MRNLPLTHRSPAVAGLSYSASPRQLSSQIQGWLHGTLVDEAQLCPKLLMVPHAGFMYSGSVADPAYALLVPHRLALHGLALSGA